MGDLLDDYLNIISEFTDAPDIFLQSCAFHMISTTLGQFFEIYDSHIRRPNLWFILSSIPGRTRSSTKDVEVTWKNHTTTPTFIINVLKMD